MTVRRSPLLFCFLSLLLTACSGTASAPESAEKAKLSAEVDKMFAIIRWVQTIRHGRLICAICIRSERLSSLK
jgi:outer membrane biogenesis lipoprotein LolB